ncbi:MAG TPA: glutamate racemase [Anaerolineaceae bacterium]|nr:glutamate racemase [Anaerolineaceae bacterium]HPN53638.1 glutamate racemase [Anaerolineaceae bacterium]
MMQPVGIFDSGVGGLSVLRAIRQILPSLPVIYVADQAHVPYGPRSLEEVRAFSEGVTRFLLSQNCQMVVVACNAASAAALTHLRRRFPQTPFVGMEPAVKPAAEQTLSGQVGVLATPATFQGALYASVVERFARGVVLYQDTCPGLVGQIEQGALDAPETRAILEKALQPMLIGGIDVVVLGCTHYPFVIPLIQQICGPQVRVIDPAPAVARQVQRLLNGAVRQDDPSPQLRFYTSGAPEKMAALLPNLLGETHPVGQLHWDGLTLSEGDTKHS